MYTPLEYLEFNMDTKNDGLESLEHVSPFEYICAVLGIYVRFAGRCKPSRKTNIAHSSGNPPCIGSTSSNIGFPIVVLVYRGVDNNTLETNSHIPYQPALLRIIYLYPYWICFFPGGNLKKKHDLVRWSLKNIWINRVMYLFWFRHGNMGTIL